MLILFGKKIVENKKIRFALTEVFGIGFSSANKMCNDLSIPLNAKVSGLSEDTQNLISAYIKEHFIVDKQLKSAIKTNIETYIDLQTVRGFRHRSFLPVRGQRTHSNGRTRKRLKKR
jgi:small subunit ribosomal protein S13